MKKAQVSKYYSPAEEKTNIISHALGFVLSIIATILLILHAAKFGIPRYTISFAIFGISLMVLYAASTLYHSANIPLRRNRLKIFDHAAIYVLIAGTYTPFTLVTLTGTTGWAIFGVTWGAALVGVVLKLFYTGRFSILSTIMYVIMGAGGILFAIKPLINSLPSGGLYWLFVGGVAYIIGAILYSIKKIPFNHAIFHILVLVGSFCHFISIFYFVLPNQ
jgi:channel protein, hemolysin III family